MISGAASEEDEVAHQRRLAELVLGAPFARVLRAALEAELEVAIAEGDEGRVRDLELEIRACEAAEGGIGSSEAGASRD